MFKSTTHRKQAEQKTRHSSTGSQYWAPSWQQMLTSQTTASSTPAQRRGKETEEDVRHPQVHYNVNAMLGNVGTSGSSLQSQPPLQLAAIPEMEEEEPPAQMMRATLQRQSETPPVENRTGMSDQLKSGLEQMSGFDLSAVRVHRNSARPAQLNAHAYAQGQDIHLAPGQDQHLPHEAWHVVQQMQGRVRPTMQEGGVAINDDRALEREADRMGAQAAGR